MHYAILRTDKIKSKADITRALKHCFREQPTNNADSSRTAENTSFHASSVEQGLSRFDQIITEAQKDKKKIRTDAVLAIEYLVTASPEAMKLFSHDQQNRYFAKSLAWIEEKHGKENVIAASIHRDETTPHLSVFVVPRDKTGSLNAKHFLGGAEKMRKIQDDFHERVAENFTLERGLKGSKATHQGIKSFYGTVVGELTKLPSWPAPVPTLELKSPSVFASDKKKKDYDDAVLAQAAKKLTYDEALRLRRLAGQSMAKKYEKAALVGVLLKPENERLRRENSKMSAICDEQKTQISLLDRRVFSAETDRALFSSKVITAKRNELRQARKAEKAQAEAEEKTQAQAEAAELAKIPMTEKTLTEDVGASPSPEYER